MNETPFTPRVITRYSGFFRVTASFIVISSLVSGYTIVANEAFERVSVPLAGVQTCVVWRPPFSILYARSP